MHWFKGKSTGNHRFSHLVWGFPVNFAWNQSIESFWNQCVFPAAKVALGANPPVLQCTTFARRDVAQPRVNSKWDHPTSVILWGDGHQWLWVTLFRKRPRHCSNQYLINIYYICLDSFVYIYIYCFVVGSHMRDTYQWFCSNGIPGNHIYCMHQGRGKTTTIDSIFSWMSYDTPRQKPPADSPFTLVFMGPIDPMDLKTHQILSKYPFKSLIHWFGQHF